MQNDMKNDYLTRERLLLLLSDDEVASVSSAETAQLANGDEFVDLERLGEGVQTAELSTITPGGRVLPRKAVQASTWSKILKELNGSPAAPRAGA